MCGLSWEPRSFTLYSVGRNQFRKIRLQGLVIIANAYPGLWSPGLLPPGFLHPWVSVPALSCEAKLARWRLAGHPYQTSLFGMVNSGAIFSLVRLARWAAAIFARDDAVTTRFFLGAPTTGDDFFFAHLAF